MPALACARIHCPPRIGEDGSAGLPAFGWEVKPPQQLNLSAKYLDLVGGKADSRRIRRLVQLGQLDHYGTETRRILNLLMFKASSNAVNRGVHLA